MQLLLVIFVALIVGFHIQRRMGKDNSTASASVTDFEESEPHFGEIGVRDITGMSSDGKSGIRDVGDIGL